MCTVRQTKQNHNGSARFPEFCVNSCVHSITMEVFKHRVCSIGWILCQFMRAFIGVLMGVLDLLNFGYFVSSRFDNFHCNAMMTSRVWIGTNRAHPIALQWKCTNLLDAKTANFHRFGHNLAWYKTKRKFIRALIDFPILLQRERENVLKTDSDSNSESDLFPV